MKASETKIVGSALKQKMNYKDVSVLKCVSALPQTMMQSMENASTLCLETSNAANWCKREPR